jgi:ribonuclease BN (tRNA processing enzyme)
VAFEMTVLGSAGSHTGAGRVCSGYLLSAGDTRIMLDCGNGSTAVLQQFMPFEDLDGVIVTHRHVDHCIDLIGMFYALRFHADGHRTQKLYAAPQVHQMLTSLLSDDSAFAFNEVFHHIPIDVGDHFRIGTFEFECFPAVHPVPTVALRITAEGRVLTYSSDTAHGPGIVEAARGSDLFLCEATWQGDGSKIPPGIHLTACQAAELAIEAGVDRLMLTHVLGSLDPERSAKEATKAFKRPVELALDGETFVI